MKTISVIVPVYNGIQFLEKCIDSICKQTYQKLEIIAVDDGSTDGSGELLDRLALKEPRIHVIHQENGGLSAARNSGIKAAAGEYFGFVDCDDYLEPEMYADLMRFADEKKISIVQASRIEESISGEILPNVCIPPAADLLISSIDFFRELLLHRGDASFCTKLVKASLFENECFPNGILNEDFHLLVRILPKAKTVGILSNQYYHVVYFEQSLTRKKSENTFSKTFLDMIDNADMIEKLVSAEYPSLMIEAKRFALFQRLDYLLHVPLSQMHQRNAFYRSVVGYLRDNIFNVFHNSYLTKKNKLYLFLLSVAPKLTRQIHAAISRQR